MTNDIIIIIIVIIMFIIAVRITSFLLSSLFNFLL